MTGKLANKVALVTGGRRDRSRLTGSIASIKGIPSFLVYNASKAAVRSFARSWIADLKGRAIRPGHVETPGPVRPDVGGAESGGRGAPSSWPRAGLVGAGLVG